MFRNLLLGLGILNSLSFADISKEFPSYQYVFSQLDIPESFIHDKNFVRFVNQNKYTLRKNYISMLRTNKNVMFPTLVKHVIETHSPYTFIYVPIIESSLKIDNKSPTKATGLWQFTKLTGQDLKFIMNKYVDQRNDPIISTNKGVQYLHKLGLLYPNNKYMALMSYNAGPGYIKRKTRGNYNLSFLISDRSPIKFETKRYIQKVLLMAMIGENHLFKYDSEIESIKNSSTGNYLVRLSFQSYQTFASVSKKYNIPVKTLKKYNKQFNRYNPRFKFINIPRGNL